MSIRFEPVKKGDVQISKVKKLFQTAFPANEQIPFWLALRLAKKDFVEFLSLYDNDLWVGLIYIATDKDLTAVLYFAIEDDMRAKGYGSKVLAAVRERYPANRLLLLIEELNPKAPNYEQRVRRKQFYQKNGYSDAGIISKEGVQYFEALSTCGIVKKEEYGALMKKFFGPICSLLIKPQLFDKDKHQPFNAFLL